MNAAAKQSSNLIQSVDWAKHSAEQWLEQYGLWVNDQRVKGAAGYVSPMASWLSSQQDRRRKDFRLSRCMLTITDDEAAAVGRIIIDLSRTMPAAAYVIKSRVEYGRSFASIAAQSMGGLSAATVYRHWCAGKKYIEGRMGKTC